MHMFVGMLEIIVQCCIVSGHSPMFFGCNQFVFVLLQSQPFLFIYTCYLFVCICWVTPFTKVTALCCNLSLLFGCR
jgi:hypothetical protein